MGTLASGSIDLKSLKIAGEGASKYITEISGDGIKIHDGIGTNPNYVSITSTGMEIYQKTNNTTVNKVAEFKSYINIGSGNNNNNNVGSALIGTGLIAENERQVVLGAYNRSPNSGTFVIGGGQNSSNRANLLSVHNISGQTVTDTFIASTTSSGQSFTVTNIITSITQINVDDTTLSSSNYTYTGQDVTINTSIAEGSKVEIAYVTSSQKGCMVLGQAQAVFGAFSITMADSAAYGYGSIAGGDSSDSPGAIKASGIGSIAMGKIVSAGEMTAFGIGSSVYGYVNSSTITASGDGASIRGCFAKGTIEASGTGASIYGYIINSTMEANNHGASIHGYAYNNSTMTASGTGASIRGLFAKGTIEASGKGASIQGGASGGAMTASGEGASIQGIANNNSIMIASGTGASIYGYAFSDSTMNASGEGALIYGYVDYSTMTASGRGTSIHGCAYINGTMTASGEGASICGYAHNSTMTASNRGSIALNESTHALKRAQLAIGSFNEDDSATTTVHPSGNTDYGTYAFIIGNGVVEGSRSNALTVDWRGNIIAQGMAGMVQMFAGATAPTGWLICDGAAVSRETYATLFAVIGTTYGVGDGSTTFNLPDLRSRMPIGAGQGTGLTNRALASLGGSEYIQQHQHGFTNPTIASSGAHVHTLNLRNAGTSGNRATNNVTYGASGHDYQNSNPVVSSGSHSHTYSANGAVGNVKDISTGQSGNMPPYIGINFIICTGKTS